jgi:hypothetical protein
MSIGSKLLISMNNTFNVMVEPTRMVAPEDDGFRVTILTCADVFEAGSVEDGEETPEHQRGRRPKLD